METLLETLEKFIASEKAKGVKFGPLLSELESRQAEARAELAKLKEARATS